MSKNVKRTRLWASLAAAALTIIVVGPLAAIAHGRDSDRARSETLASAQENIYDAMLINWDSAEAPINTWQIDLNENWTDNYGETTIEPPLLTLAEPMASEGGVREYDFDGRWLAVGEPTPDERVILTVVGRDSEIEAVSRSRLTWTAITSALALLAAATCWWVAGKAQAPVARAHVMNRDFIADAAHELRTPLAIVQASAGHALSRDRDTEAYRESLTEILEAAERASSGVGELLEFARLEAGQATVRLAPLRLDLLAEEVAAVVRVDGVTIDAQPASAAVVSADYNLVRQMLINLTENAAARATKVSLSTHLERDFARVEIVDDGPGFDPGVIDHVFERFRRGDRSGSVGLGMAVARTIAELHHGACHAANLDDGGAVVTVRLPHGNVRS